MKLTLWKFGVGSGVGGTGVAVIGAAVGVGGAGVAVGLTRSVGFAFKAVTVAPSASTVDSKSGVDVGVGRRATTVPWTEAAIVAETFGVGVGADGGGEVHPVKIAAITVARATKENPIARLTPR